MPGQYQVYEAPSSFSRTAAERDFDRFGVFLSEASRKFMLAKLELLDQRVKESIVLLGGDISGVEAMKGRWVIIQQALPSKHLGTVEHFRIRPLPTPPEGTEAQFTITIRSEEWSISATPATLHPYADQLGGL